MKTPFEFAPGFAPTDYLVADSGRLLPVDHFVKRLSDDESYCYLVIARHIVSGERCTTDRFLATNVYGPLWMDVLVLLVFAPHEPKSYVQAIFLGQLTLYAGALDPQTERQAIGKNGR